MTGKIEYLWDVHFRSRTKVDRQELRPEDYWNAGREPRDHELYFAGEDFDEEGMTCYDVERPYSVVDVDGQKHVVHRRNEYPIIQAIKIGRRRFVVRQIDKHLIFRKIDSAAAEDAMFLPDTTIREFADAYSRRQPGRCIMHVPLCLEELEEYHGVYLFFDIDGTGFALNLTLGSETGPVPRVIEHERVDFRWDDISEEDYDVLEDSVEDLHEFCETLFVERVNPHLREPYVYLDRLEGVPLSWQSGSEQEFRKLAIAICVTEPELFGEFEEVTAVYRAVLENKRGGFLYVERGDRYDGDHYT